MNILLTSVGRRSYLVDYFKEAIGADGEIHVSNSTDITPAFTRADKSVVSPLIYDDSYIPFLLEYCKANKIGAIISLFDLDLYVLSKHKMKFERIGTKVLVSDKNVIDICNDKWKTHVYLLEKGFNSPKTCIGLDIAIKNIRKKQLEFPLMIKPRWGTGSIGVYEACDEQELEVFYSKTQNAISNTYLKHESGMDIKNSVMIQEKLRGQEYGLDIINDLNGVYQNTVVKLKYAMRSGETDCAKTVANKQLKELGEEIGRILGHIGNLDVDVFIKDNIAYILEMNARFGGGYPFSHVSGVNLPLAIVKWLNNERLEDDVLKEKIGVVSHKDICISIISE